MVFSVCVCVCTYHDITSFDSSPSSLPESLLSWLSPSAYKHIHKSTLQGFTNYYTVHPCSANTLS